MSLTELLAITVLVVGVPLNLYVVIRLRHLSSLSPARLLRFQYIIQLLILATVVVFGAIFVNNDQPTPPLTAEATKLFTRTVLLALATIPAARWLYLTRKPPPDPSE